jgi:hypothetical protein
VAAENCDRCSTLFIASAFYDRSPEMEPGDVGEEGYISQPHWTIACSTGFSKWFGDVKKDGTRNKCSKSEEFRTE